MNWPGKALASHLKAWPKVNPAVVPSLEDEGGSLLLLSPKLPAFSVGKRGQLGQGQVALNVDVDAVYHTAEPTCSSERL